MLGGTAPWIRSLVRLRPAVKLNDKFLTSPEQRNMKDTSRIVVSLKRSLPPIRRQAYVTAVITSSRVWRGETAMTLAFVNKSTFLTTSDCDSTNRQRLKSWPLLAQKTIWGALPRGIPRCYWYGFDPNVLEVTNNKTFCSLTVVCWNKSNHWTKPQQNLRFHQLWANKGTVTSRSA